MNPSRALSSHSLALLALSGMAACGSSDPLVGTWSTMVNTGALALEVKLELHGDQSAVIDESIRFPGTGDENPGCTLALHAEGLRWSTTRTDGAMSLSVDSSQINGYVERTGCADPAQNQPRTTLSGNGAALAEVPGLAGTYTIQGDTLMITTATSNGTVTVTYTRE